jgi:ribose transport system substrate-binding protein
MLDALRVTMSSTRWNARRAPSFLLAASAILLLVGRERGPLGPAECDAQGKTHRIAVIPKGTTHEFWKSIHAGAVKAEREVNAAGGIQVKVEWKGPQKEDDRAQQIQVVQNFIAAGVSGIVLAPLDDTALLRPVRDAGRAKIPVVIFDSGLKGDVGKDFVSYVATDNLKGGVLGAKRLGEILGGKGKAILLRYQEGSASTMEREKGFLDTLGKEFPGVKLLSSNLYGGATTETSYRTSQNLLTRFKGEVDGIFTPNESSTFGMLRALKDAGLAGKVKFVGFDASEALVKAMKEGEIHGLVLQNPVKMGYLGVKTMVAHLEGKPLERHIDTGAVIITPENMDEPEMKILHSPDLSEWLGK